MLNTDFWPCHTSTWHCSCHTHSTSRSNHHYIYSSEKQQRETNQPRIGIYHYHLTLYEPNVFICMKHLHNFDLWRNQNFDLVPMFLWAKLIPASNMKICRWGGFANSIFLIEVIQQYASIRATGTKSLKISENGLTMHEIQSRKHSTRPFLQRKWINFNPHCIWYLPVDCWWYD